ncbi:neuronal acetylcholine receptor subunit beta-3-like [Ostrea edulis]|uniref:neuronal acetylcholine receptor subunit beta-3-like n=1 Tax=Ostrea edulis TaxID=37623 RepID=UPI0020962D2A|nr:neuronal acetylcholine receptor subunit beta-3-like [Ostrea edulis]
MNLLLHGYSKKIRPVLDQSKSVDMAVSLWISSINDVIVVEQKMVVSAYVQVTWRDERLSWNATQWGIHTMQFIQGDLWIPDLVLMNGFKTMQPLGGDSYFLSVTSNGEIVWDPFMVFESKCDIDVSYFPFDKQTCSIIFGTWSYGRNEVFLYVPPNTKVEFREVVENSIWEVTSADATFDPVSNNNAVTFIIHLRRKPLHYFLNMILPIVCLGVLNGFVFIIPADAGEKMGYTVSIFLSFIVFLTMIRDELPVNSGNVSIMSIYVMIQIGLSMLVIFITSLQLRLHHRKPEREIGQFCRSLVRLERRLQCVDKGPRSGCCKRRVHTIQIASEGTSATSLENDISSKAEEVVEWMDVSSAIDFLSFWFLVFTEVVVSIGMFSYSISQWRSS